MIGICAMIFWPKSKDSNVAIAEPPMSAAKPTTPAPTPSSANPVPRAAPAPEQTWPVPFNGARGPESSAQTSSVNQEPEVPIGNSNIARENLYKFGFDDHLSAVKRTLAASKGLNKTEFDISSEWLRSNRPTPPTWPPADAKLRRIFNERIELL